MLNLFVPEISVAEKVFRSVVIYLFFVLAFRLMGKRQVGQLTPFDLVVLLVISNVVQNAVIGNDNSLGGGLIGAITIFALNYAFVEVTYRSRRARHFLEPYPTVLIHDGRIIEEHLRRERISRDDLHGALRRGRERISRDDLHGALRRAGLVEVSEAWFAVLEANGGISVIPWRTEAKSVR